MHGWTKGKKMLTDPHYWCIYRYLDVIVKLYYVFFCGAGMSSWKFSFLNFKNFLFLFLSYFSISFPFNYLSHVSLPSLFFFFCYSFYLIVKSFILSFVLSHSHYFFLLHLLTLFSSITFVHLFPLSLFQTSFCPFFFTLLYLPFFKKFYFFLLTFISLFFFFFHWFFLFFFQFSYFDLICNVLFFFFCKMKEIGKIVKHQKVR